MSLRVVWVATCLMLGGCGAARGGKSGSVDAAIPVVVSAAQLQTVPLTLAAVGNLIAVNTAAVRARVDGQLLSVEFKEGDAVRAGQVLFRLDARPYAALLAQANANLAKDQATLERARAQRQRYDDLVSKDYVSPDDYAQVKANEQTAAAAVLADQAAVQGAQLNLDYCTIRAPISGRSGIIAIRGGNLLKASDGTVLVTITQLDPVYVDFAVPQRYLDELRQSISAGGAMVSLATADGEVAYDHRSKLDFIDNVVDAGSGTVHVRATVANADYALWPAQFVHVRLQLTESEQVVTVPTTAVGKGPAGSYVFVLDNTGHVQQRNVTVARQTEMVAVIATGVAAGDRVVSDGQSRLQDKALVVVKPAVAHGAQS